MDLVGFRGGVDANGQTNTEGSNNDEECKL